MSTDWRELKRRRREQRRLRYERLELRLSLSGMLPAMDPALFLPQGGWWLAVEAASIQEKATDAFVVEDSELHKALPSTDEGREGSIHISSQHVLDFIRAATDLEEATWEIQASPEYCKAFDAWVAKLGTGEEVLDMRIE